MKFKDIREVFWPILEKSKKNGFKDYIPDDIIVTDSNLPTAFDLAQKIFEYQEKRLSTVESKSIVFIGTLSVVTGIMISILKDLKILPLCYSVIFLVAIIYFSTALIFSIKALNRRTYYSIGFEDFNDKSCDYQKKLITKLTNYSRKNSCEIDKKVDFMTMAQEFFQRGVVTVILSSIIIVFKNFISLGFIFNNLNRFLIGISINIWVFIIIGLLFVSNFVLLSILFCKIKVIKQVVNNERHNVSLVEDK
jgi:hypothetical protein